MRVRGWKKAAFVGLTLSVLTGCWNMREIERMFYAHALGVDYRNGKYIIYVQILDFSTLGTQETSGENRRTTEGAWVGRGEGSSLLGAIHQLYATSQRRIFWAHLQTVILSERAVKEKLEEIMDVLTRYNELRYTHWMFGAHDNVEELLLASPILESTPVYSQLNDPEDVFHQSSFVPPKRLYRLISEMNEPGTTAYLPVLTTVQGFWKDQQQSFRALKVDGVLIVKNWTYRGYLGMEDMIGFRWVDSRTKRTPVTIRKEVTVAALTLEGPDVDIRSTVRGGKVYFDLKVKVKGSLSEHSENISEAEIESLAEELIRDEIRHTYRKGLELKADVLNLMEPLYRRNTRLWHQVTHGGEFPLEEDSLQKIEVKVHITNSGRSVLPARAEGRAGIETSPSVGMADPR